MGIGLETSPFWKRSYFMHFLSYDMCSYMSSVKKVLCIIYIYKYDINMIYIYKSYKELF